VSSVITDSCSDCGQPHNAHTSAKINEVKDLALIFWSVYFAIKTIFCQNRRFSTYFSLTYI